MDEMSISIVRKSLVRRVIMGNMPAQWLWLNVISCLLVFSFFFLSFSLIAALCIIPFGILSHILLHKAYSKDEAIFAVFMRHMFMNDYIPATSRANYLQNKY